VAGRAVNGGIPLTAGGINKQSGERLYAGGRAGTNYGYGGMAPWNYHPGKKNFAFDKATQDLLNTISNINHDLDNIGVSIDKYGSFQANGFHCKTTYVPTPK
jgi:hypothetical protein